MIWTAMRTSAAAARRIDKQWLLVYAFVIEAKKDSVWLLVIRQERCMEQLSSSDKAVKLEKHNL